MAMVIPQQASSWAAGLLQTCQKHDKNDLKSNKLTKLLSASCASDSEVNEETIPLNVP